VPKKRFRVVSANLNGIRAAGRKGFYEWLTKCDPDVVCMQETKAQMAVLLDDLYRPENYHYCFSDAIKKGYSGVGIYSKRKPDNVIEGLGWDVADNEGRYIQMDFADLSVASIYLPSGSSGDERQGLKEDFMRRYMKKLKKDVSRSTPMIICGDWNIVHTEKDIKNFKSNQKTSGCLPHEREWIDNVFNKVGWVDAFRQVNQEAHQYTWWSNRGRAWDNNVGWRIDYQVITPDIADTVMDSYVYKDERFSDHSPLVVDYRF